MVGEWYVLSKLGNTVCCVVARPGQRFAGRGKGGAALGRQHTAHSSRCSLMMTHERVGFVTRCFYTLLAWHVIKSMNMYRLAYTIYSLKGLNVFLPSDME